MLEFYKRKRDEHHAAYLAAVEVCNEKLAAKHLKEYENYAQQVKELSK
tara:strand:- start:17722 stop:17865 length:144 start_codon:yes stop_codon:yes gene_type:complete